MKIIQCRMNIIRIPIENNLHVVYMDDRQLGWKNHTIYLEPNKENIRRAFYDGVLYIRTEDYHRLKKEGIDDEGVIILARKY